MLMKLLNRVSVYYLVISLFVFSFGGLFFYFVFKDEVYEELDEQLRDEKRDLERILANSDSLIVKYNGVNFSLNQHRPLQSSKPKERTRVCSMNLKESNISDNGGLV